MWEDKDDEGAGVVREGYIQRYYRKEKEASGYGKRGTYVHGRLARLLLMVLDCAGTILHAFVHLGSTYRR